MRAYYLFLKNNFNPVAFGWLLTFFSSFGQTFLISLFVPFILSQFQLSRSEFGSYYAAATLVSSLFLLQYGHLVDHSPLRPFTTRTILLLVSACLLLAFAVHPAMVFLALIGLRLGGQGLMSHISLTVMSRHFTVDRGKALSLSSLGFPMGEMIFPLIIGVALSYWNWQVALFISAAMLVILLFVIRQQNVEAYDVATPTAEVSGKEKWAFYRSLVNGKAFWILLPPVVTFSFIGTGIFFYQYIFAEEKGWPLEYYSLCFTGYAVVRFLFSLYGGLLTDRLSARTLFPFYLIPLMLGLLALAIIPGKFAALFFLLLTGISAGLSGIISNAIIAELYGSEKVGLVRSFFSMIMVFSSAVAPIIVGSLLDHHIAMNDIALGCAALVLVSCLNSFRIRLLQQDLNETANLEILKTDIV
ncbi:MFS transporter [Adhaeribacter soli]|uniref:MFS transporter n=1 Tax=Adhaeribacter soli TaxID=2607655 RepID=A0A5N1J658_9BACT|nr:MFS transporter [Adhaeribacter soli]KAA9345653.1 MFS transporter [Adhaeribacter soli]